jgi:RNA polymerase sigma-70 factor, ECF subfamily
MTAPLSAILPPLAFPPLDLLGDDQEPAASAFSALLARRDELRRMDPTRALIERALGGDAGAFREIFVQHRGDVSRLVYRMLGPSPDVDDVVQDVFLHVYRSLASFRGDSRFSTWLYRLTVNVTRMHLRRARSRPKFSDVELPEVPDAALDGGRDDGPEAQVERADRVRTLYRLLEGLSEKKREVLVLHDFEGVAAKDIAELLSVPVLTVRTRLFYARKELYAAMASEPSLAHVLSILGQDLHGKPKLDAVPTSPRAAASASTDARESDPA